MISSAERVVLREMYPPGCRVELMSMEEDPYVKLTPGELGTVQFVDDAGQIHVSWDSGHSLALVFPEDRCRCVMKEEEFTELLKRIKKMPFENLEKMKLYVPGKLRSVFPKIEFLAEKNEVVLETGVSTFMKKDIKIALKYEEDTQGHIFIKNVDMQGTEIKGKVPFTQRR